MNQLKLCHYVDYTDVPDDAASRSSALTRQADRARRWEEARSQSHHVIATEPDPRGA